MRRAFELYHAGVLEYIIEVLVKREFTEMLYIHYRTMLIYCARDSNILLQISRRALKIHTFTPSHF